MKRSDLKTGMRLELEDGKRCIVMLDTERGNSLCGDDTWMQLDDAYDENLMRRSTTYTPIKKIYSRPANSELERSNRKGKCLHEFNKIDPRITRLEETIKDAQQQIEELKND